MKRFLTYFSLYVLLCINGAFALNFPSSEWNLASYEGAYATYNDGFISVLNGGSDYWHVQLTRRNIELQMGKTYEVNFFLQGAGVRRYVEVRIGRDGFPYDAFAEFGEVSATINGQMVTKTFKMQSGNVSNARFEFNLGKYSSSVFVSDISLTCLDCNSSNEDDYLDYSPIIASMDQGYVVIADTVDFRDYSMGLGNIFGSKLELGADAKIYGNVNVSGDCFLRERANINGDLFYTVPCKEQNNVSAKTRNKGSVLKPVVSIPNVSVGITPISVKLDESITLPPGNYGLFYANSRSKVRLSSGVYHFQNFYTEPDVEISFDLSSGPVSIGVLNNVRFGDRNRFSVIGGNPSEITWNIVGNAVDLGTDGLYYGKFIAPSAFVRMPSRSHLVGSVYARKFVMEPQSSVSQEPRATEISHSEEHFGPFFNSGIFRYRSVLPLSISSLEMFVYADDIQVKVNGSSSKIVELVSSNTAVIVSLKRNQISGFPIEAFSANYIFNFEKSANYRIYWNPQTKCKQGCDGYTAETAIGDFATVLETANKTGREINMVGGVWDVTENYKDGIVPWKVGFELVGYTGNILDLTSTSSMPTIFLGESSHIQILGKSPRSLTGFWIGNGFNKNSGGAIASESQHLKLKNLLLSAHKSDTDGGALFSVDTVEMFNVHFKNNQSKGNGGAVYVDGLLKMQNVIFDRNIAVGNGGASYTGNKVLVQNAIFSQNESNGEGGAWFASKGSIKVSNATIFDNNGKKGFSAVGGDVTGEIYNSILWKNIKPSCTLENCKKEVSPSLSIHHSIAETSYNGIGNLVNDPKFVNESKPSGDNDFMSMTTGLTLQNGSPAIGAGVKDAFVLETDILNFVRGERVDLGAYMWYDLNSDFEFGEYAYGVFTKRDPAMPIYERLGDERDIRACGNSPSGRVMRKRIPKNIAKNISKAVMEFSLVDQYGNPYSMSTIKVDFLKVGEIDGYCIFQTLTKAPSYKDYDPNKHGRLVLFTSDVTKAGVYGSVRVMPIMNLGDKFVGKAVSWE